MFNRFIWPTLEFSELVKRTRILIIDNLDFEYEKLFVDDNYSITKWDDVKDLPKLEQGLFDIILLDIQGIGRKISDEQGFGVLKHLKKVNPTQIVIAYSDADYSLKYDEFFKLADDSIDKSKDYLAFKQKIDKFIRVRFSLDYYLDAVHARFPGEIKKDKLKKVFEQSIKKQNGESLRQTLEKVGAAKDDISFALNVLSFVITTVTSITGTMKP